MSKSVSLGKLSSSVIYILLVIFAVGCSKSSNSAQNNKSVDLEIAMEEDIISEKTESHVDLEIDMEEDILSEKIESHVNVDEQKSLIPLRPQWRSEDLTYGPDFTIYYKTYYDDFVRGYLMWIDYPDINLKEEIEDYFIMDQKGNVKIDSLVDLFFDSRTIEMDENVLKNIFYSYGYEVDFKSTIINDLHVRFVEINEIDGLSLYPSRIFIQTWDNEHIYLQDITGPIPRKIRSIITVDDKEDPIMIAHSTSVSEDYISEEELIFWVFRGSYWNLTSLEYTIDSSHAHNAGNAFPDENRESLYDPFYYPDGIVYRPSIQCDGVNYYTYRLGVMEEIDKNKRFRMIGICEYEDKAEVVNDCYIEFEIN